MIRREGMKVVLAIIWALCVPPGVVAQVVESADSIANEYELKDVVVRVSSRTRSQSRVESVDIIGKSQLIRPHVVIWASRSRQILRSMSVTAMLRPVPDRLSFLGSQVLTCRC